jgi:hypothetical protein
VAAGDELVDDDASVFSALATRGDTRNEDGLDLFASAYDEPGPHGAAVDQEVERARNTAGRWSSRRAASCSATT